MDLYRSRLQQPIVRSVETQTSGRKRSLGSTDLVCKQVPTVLQYKMYEVC